MARLNAVALRDNKQLAIRKLFNQFLAFFIEKIWVKESQHTNNGITTIKTNYRLRCIRSIHNNTINNIKK